MQVECISYLLYRSYWHFLPPISRGPVIIRSLLQTKTASKTYEMRFVPTTIKEH